MALLETKRSKFAQHLLFLLPAVIVVSPPLTSLFEVAIYFLFFITPELRRRFTSILSQPMVISGLAFCLLIVLSSLWSDAPWEEKSRHIISWRKIFLLPIAASLLYNSELKQRFLLTFIISIGVFATISWLGYLFSLELPNPPNSLLRNHSTQGVIFSVAIFSAIALLFHAKNLTPKIKLALTIAGLIILTNYFFISTSRSGYVAGLILAICIVLYSGKKRIIFFVPIVCLVFASILYFSPTPHAQIKKVWTEITNIDNSQELTSSGARIVFWKNTIPIIKNAPPAGHGLKSMSLEYEKQIKNQTGWKSTITRDPHNQYLLILVEQGIIGLIVFILFVFFCFKQKTEKIYMHIGRSILLVWLGTSMFNGHFSASVEGKFIFLWCGAMLAQLATTKTATQEALRQT